MIRTVACAAMAGALLLSATPAFVHVTQEPARRPGSRSRPKRYAVRTALVALALLSGGLAAATHASLATAAEVTSGNLLISGGFSRATLPNAPVGGGYLTITNRGGESDRLLSAASPVAGVVQIHEMKMEGDMMKMNELPAGIEIPAGATVTLKPGGLHLMFLQLTGPLVEGTKIPLALSFEKAGSVEVELSVESPAAKGPAADAKHGG